MGKSFENYARETQELITRVAAGEAFLFCLPSAHYRTIGDAPRRRRVTDTQGLKFG